MLPLYCLYPYSPNGQRLGRHTYGIRLFCKLWFWCVNLFTTQFVKNKAMKNVSWSVLYLVLIDFGRFNRSLSRIHSIYLHWQGLSALHVSTIWTLLESLHVERMAKQAPSFIVCIVSFINLLSARRKNENWNEKVYSLFYLLIRCKLYICTI